MVQCSEEKPTQVQGEGEILGQRKESGVFEGCGAVRVIDAVRGLEGCRAKCRRKRLEEVGKVVSRLRPHLGLHRQQQELNEIGMEGHKRFCLVKKR